MSWAVHRDNYKGFTHLFQTRNTRQKKRLPSEGKTYLHNGYGSTLLKSTERLYVPTIRIQKPLNVSKGDLSVILESRTRMCLSFSKLY